MRRIIQSLFWCIFPLLLIFAAQAEENVSELDFSYLYNPDAELHIQHKISVADSTYIFFKINTYSGISLEENYDLSYGFIDSYEKPLSISDSLDVYQHLLDSFRNEYYLKLTLPTTSNNSILVLQIFNVNTTNKYYFDVPIVTDNEFPKPSFLMMQKGKELPFWQNFVSKMDSFYIRGYNPNQRFFGFLYKTDFQPSGPPMADIPQNVQENIRIDSSFRVQASDPFTINNDGLIFIQQDTNSYAGISLRAESMFYPKVAKIENIIEALIYITTKGEKTKLNDADDKKKALDRFWLDLAKTPQRAKSIIRFYFNRIEYANRYFTTYKEGWKTDQGMIYAVFGKPDQVLRTEKDETWIYDKRDELPKLSFTFMKVKNLFSPNHYTLIKDKRYEMYWHRAIDLIRKGRMSI